MSKRIPVLPSGAAAVAASCSFELSNAARALMLEACALRQSLSVSPTNAARSSEEFASTLGPAVARQAEWPIHRAYLAALLDIGMNADQIARYFRVDPSEVYGMMGTAGDATRAASSMISSAPDLRFPIFNPSME